MENRFDIYDVPAGHEARFAQKLSVREERKGRVYRILGWSAAAAAVVAVFLVTARNPFFGARTPEAVYSAYLQEVGGLYELFAQRLDDDGENWYDTLESLTKESVPMYEQLPDDLSDREKTMILKQYYGKLLAGANELKYHMNKQ